MDQTEDDRSSRGKSINNQARPRGDAAEAGGGGNRRHDGEMLAGQREKGTAYESYGHQVNSLAHQGKRVWGGGRQPNGYPSSLTQGKPTCMALKGES
jgi:hypothetical protein